MNIIIISMIVIVLILGFLYFTMKRSSETNGISKGSELFPEYVDDPSEALVSNIKIEDVEHLIKRDFPEEKYAEVVDALSKYTKA
ncbi:MAG TPA: hypothetical protein VKE92_11955, partial [Anaerolineales bacterium]|nr:hypothetical protein [Anaerolineales bacterium]